jgi:hypothetical protein
LKEKQKGRIFGQTQIIVNLFGQPEKSPEARRRPNIFSVRDKP